MDWFRSYHGAPSDTKLALIAKVSGQHRAFVTAVWWELLDHASRNVTQRGDVSRIDTEIVGVQQGMETHEVQCIIDAMIAKGMIVDGQLCTWSKYQVRREDPQATERKQKERESKKKMSRNVSTAVRD